MFWQGIYESMNCVYTMTSTNCVDWINFWFFLPPSTAKQCWDFCKITEGASLPTFSSTMPTSNSFIPPLLQFCLKLRWDFAWTGLAISNSSTEYQLLIQAPPRINQNKQMSQKPKISLPRVPETGERNRGSKKVVVHLDFSGQQLLGTKNWFTSFLWWLTLSLSQNKQRKHSKFS